jgi:hypothetical protein
MKKLSEVTHQLQRAGIMRPYIDLCRVCRRSADGEPSKEIGQMSNLTKIALSTAIILSTAFSVLTAANAGATREQAASSGTGMAAYDRDGGIVSSQWR